MTAYCPKCDFALRQDPSYKRARCPNCKKEWDPNRTYVEYGADKNGVWEDYTDTLHIIAARVDKYKKKTEPAQDPFLTISISLFNDYIETENLTGF